MQAKPETAGDAGQAEIGRPVEEPQEVQATAMPAAEVIALPMAVQAEEKPEASKPGAPPDGASGVVIPPMYQERGHAGRVARRRQEDGAQLRLF